MRGGVFGVSLYYFEDIDEMGMADTHQFLQFLLFNLTP